jgi:hypothetical protein
MALKDRVRLMLHHTTAKKNSMEYGVQSLASDFEFSRISLPYGDDTARRMSDMLANEALMWPDGDTSDLLMALWFVKFNYKSLRPTYFLPTRRKGSTGGGWSWMSKMKAENDTAEVGYKMWHRARRAKDDDRKVSAGGY